MKPPDVVIERVADVVWLVRLTGEHDLSMAPYIRQQLDLIPHGATSIVVDLSETSFLDSVALAELILARRRFESVPGRRLGVVVPRGSAAAGLFDLVDADRRFFLTFESRQAAITQLTTTSRREARPPPNQSANRAGSSSIGTPASLWGGPPGRRLSAGEGHTAK